MLRKLSAFALALFLVAALPFGPAAAAGKAVTDQARFIYTPPVKPAHKELLAFMRSHRIGRKLREVLSPVRLPRTVTFKLVECNGELNAAYGDGVVEVCYDYLAFMFNETKAIPKDIGISSSAAFGGAALDLFLHEFGHALIDILKIPVLGREEDAADFISTYIMLQFTPRDAYSFISGTAFVSRVEARRAKLKPSPELFARQHGLPQQRYFNLLCLAYGADPKLFAQVRSIGRLPEGRAEGCQEEYAQLQHAFRMLLRPHIDLELADRVRKKRRFDF